MSGRLTVPDENDPAQYENHRFPYDNPVTTRFYQEYAKYASDYFAAQAQGLNQNDFYAWEPITMRMADLVKVSAAMQRQFDNHKIVLLDAMKYSYIPRGAKFVTMGSTWLCTNPVNISGGDGTAVVQRCNTTWNHLDWYGNVVKEPIVFETEILRANAPDPQYNMVIVKGYFNVKCQRNKDTSQINDNTRMILGSSCYVVSGFSDFEQEFTGDYDSVHFLEFTIRKDEVDATIDDVENHVAGGLTYSWDVVINGKPSMQVGENYGFSVSSVRCGEEVYGTEENPISYFWESSDESVVTVDQGGNVTAVGEGTCTVRVVLEQNNTWRTNYEISVVAAGQTGTIGFSETVDGKISAFENTTLTLVGYQSESNIEWIFSGADENAYSAIVNGDSCTVLCWSGSETPLTVTAICGNESVSAVIELVGI